MEAAIRSVDLRVQHLQQSVAAVGPRNKAADKGSIAAVVVGGTALAGAVGTMTGTLLGCIFIAMISNGLIHWGIDPDLNKVVKGIIIFLAVVINSNVTFKSNSGAPKDDSNEFQVSVPRDNPYLAFIEITQAISEKVPVLLDLQNVQNVHSLPFSRKLNSAHVCEFGSQYPDQQSKSDVQIVYP